MENFNSDAGWVIQPSSLLEKPSESGNLEADNRCPKCGWETSLYPKDEYPPASYPDCA